MSIDLMFEEIFFNLYQCGSLIFFFNNIFLVFIPKLDSLFNRLEYFGNQEIISK